MDTRWIEVILFTVLFVLGVLGLLTRNRRPPD
jgi:hypothetical protein